MSATLDTPPRPKKPKRLQKYRRVWEEANPWLDSVSGNEYKANCKRCRRVFSVAHGGLADVRQHAGGDQHKINMRTDWNQTAVSVTAPEVDTKTPPLGPVEAEAQRSRGGRGPEVEEPRNTTMFNLKDFVNQRLTAAAVEIFEEFEKMLDLYKAEVTRSKEEVDNLRNQLDLLQDKPAAEAPAAHSTVPADGCDSSLLQEKLLPSTPVEMGQESNFSVKAEAAGPSHTNAGGENPDWNNGMLHSDPEVSQVKEEQEELGIDSQKQEAVFLSADDVKSEQDQPEAEFEYELQPLSSDCSAAQSENSDDEDWMESKGAQRRTKKRKAKSKQRQTDSSTQEGREVLAHEDSSAKSQSDDRISCHLCGKSFKYIGFLMNHIQTHDKTVDCHVCGITFQSAEELIKHLQSAIKKKHFCDLCGKTFTKMHLLKEHSKIHTGTKEFTCQDCGKAFLRKTDLTVHARTHSGEKPYSCDICGKAFSQRNNLKSHRRCHTGEKPYHCEVCGYSFRTSYHLKTHMRYHSGEKPYSCEICGKKFCQTGELTRHMMTHTEERPYGCHVCGMRYKFDSNLKVHMRNHEKEATVAEPT